MWAVGKEFCRNRNKGCIYDLDCVNTNRYVTSFHQKRIAMPWSSQRRIEKGNQNQEFWTWLSKARKQHLEVHCLIQLQKLSSCRNKWLHRSRVVALRIETALEDKQEQGSRSERHPPLQDLKDASAMTQFVHLLDFGRAINCSDSGLIGTFLLWGYTPCDYTKISELMPEY